MKNNSNLTGIILLVLLFIGYTWVTAPDQEQIKQEQLLQQQRVEAQLQQDSILNAQDSLERLRLSQIAVDTSLTTEQQDSLTTVIKKQKLASSFGNFTNAAMEQPAKETVLENEQLKVTFSNKGGNITRVEVKGFLQYNNATLDSLYDKEQLVLMNNPEDEFQFLIPTRERTLRTSTLYFEPTITGNSISLKAYSDDRSQYIEQVYTLPAEGYLLDYQMNMQGIGEKIPTNESIALKWKTHVAKIEKNPYYEKTMTTVYYKSGGDFDYCNCRTDDQEDLEEPIQWLSHSQQFFNTSLIPSEGTQIAKGSLITQTVPEDAPHLKVLDSEVILNTSKTATSNYNFQFYIGPNEYNELVKLDNGLEEIIPFGWSIFGFISRSIIRPLFNLFAMFISNYGVIILLLTLLIKLALFPLQYKMLLNGVKMSVLKPELEKMKAKYKDDKQGMQMAQMKMYGEYGVSPLGGCLPMVLSMPIWIALYRFFPASIAFRQKEFLWADDLVSYDSIWDFGYVPGLYNIYGDHVSLFTLLWMVSMFAFLWYNSKQMDMTAGNPQMKMMKYMQFAFPILFFFALNSWAAALTAYMLFSNIFNILQTYITKNVLINKDKLLEQMEKKKKEKASQPAKGMGKFAQMMADQQRLMEEQKKKNGGK